MGYQGKDQSGNQNINSYLRDFQIYQDVQSPINDEHGEECDQEKRNNKSNFSQNYIMHRKKQLQDIDLISLIKQDVDFYSFPV